MPDLPDLSSVAGQPLSAEQIDGIIAQIDLDIVNFLRDGKLAAINYSLPGDAGRSMNRAINLKTLVEAREYYEGLRSKLPAWEISQAE